MSTLSDILAAREAKAKKPAKKKTTNGIEEARQRN